jgi:hypothetical protein
MCPESLFFRLSANSACNRRPKKGTLLPATYIVAWVAVQPDWDPLIFHLDVPDEHLTSGEIDS